MASIYDEFRDMNVASRYDVLRTQYVRILVALVKEEEITNFNVFMISKEILQYMLVREYISPEELFTEFRI